MSQVALVPHTHWDREWYEPFQRFRMRLVDVVDDVLVRAEADPDFRFTFDGQMAAVTDYLEVRPGNTERFAAAVRGGQFAIGPWRVLLDEFLCSGESIIRNLQLGRRQAAALGPVMDVGYLPDMFGHIAQMPQILRGAGFEHACVYRGVPAEITDHAFRWSSPDGSWIRTEYLRFGYGNVSDLFDEPDDIAARLDMRVARMAPAFGAAPILAMYGTDHSGPLPALMGHVRALGDRVRVSTLAEYITEFDSGEDGLTEVQGELRSHARANILPGVISIRPALKTALAGAERMVERYAEPLQALWGSAWPAALLDLAWTKLVDSSCHDSVTGCGVDETAVQVGARIAEGGQVGQAVRDDATAALARSVPSDAALVWNPLPRPATLQVEVDLPAPADGRVVLLAADGTAVPVQEVGRNDRVLADETVDAADLPGIFQRIHDRELFGRSIRGMTLDATAEPPALRFDVAADPGRGHWDQWAARAEVTQAAADRPGAWRVSTVDEPRRRVIADIDVPALGFTAARLTAGDRPVSNPVAATAAGLAGNGISVAVNPDGTLRITSGPTVLDGVGRISESGDAGDSYNYAPPALDRVVDEPESIEVRVLESGPLRAAVRVRRVYHWPVSSTQAERSTETRATAVDLIAELRRGEPFVRLDLTFDNQVRDHRVRLHVPCARVAASSFALGQFAVTERGRHPEAGAVGEFPIPTYPANEFVAAGGAAVLLTAPSEFELLEGSDAIAVTVMRGVAYLSRNRNALRDEPAGPNLPTPLGQSIGPHRVRLAVAPCPAGWEDARLPDLVERFRLGAVVRAGAAPAGGPLAPPQEGLSVEGAGVMLSAVVAGEPGALDVRVVALTDQATEARITCAARPIGSAAEVDLLGRVGAPLGVSGGSVTVPLRPYQIATVRLSAAAADPVT